jgi:type I restriction enzyme, S subunit
VIYSTVRPYLRNIAVVEEDYRDEPIASTAFGILHPLAGINNRYVYYWLRSTSFTAYVERCMKGMAYPAINDEKFYSGPIPVPPFAEQLRIVAKLDELMALCDRLEAHLRDRDTRHAAIARASLAQFANTPTVANLELLFHPDRAISAAGLRETILTLAVRGNVVPRSTSPQHLPLEALLREASINGVSKGPTSDDSATEILRISAGTSRADFIVDEGDFKHVDLPASDVEKFRLMPNDLLACRFNGNLRFVGRFSLYRGTSGKTQVNPDKLIRFRIDSSQYDARYVCYAMNAPSTRAIIESMCATTAGNIGLSAGKLKTVEIPVPPLGEQRQIVAKVEVLMAMVDRLDQVSTIRSRASAMAVAAVAGLINRGVRDDVEV